MVSPKYYVADIFGLYTALNGGESSCFPRKRPSSIRKQYKYGISESYFFLRKMSYVVQCHSD